MGLFPLESFGFAFGLKLILDLKCKVSLRIEFVGKKNCRIID